jgi:hypothetical protein
MAEIAVSRLRCGLGLAPLLLGLAPPLLGFGSAAALFSLPPCRGLHPALVEEHDLVEHDPLDLLNHARLDALDPRRDAVDKHVEERLRDEGLDHLPQHPGERRQDVQGLHEGRRRAGGCRQRDAVRGGRQRVPGPRGERVAGGPGGLDKVEIGRYGDMEIWRYGDREIWRYGDMEIWR